MPLATGAYLLDIQKRVNAEVSALALDAQSSSDWSYLRAYFATGNDDDLDVLACKVIAWGRFFLPTFLRDSSPEFHYELIRRFFSKRNEFTACPRGFGKAQSLDSLVLTPDGWVRMGGLKAGDFVMGADGKRKKVAGFSPTTEMDLYRVTTRDGRSTLCNLEHLWEVTCPSNTGERKLIKPLSEILKNYKSQPRVDKRDGSVITEYRYFIDSCAPLEFDEKELPVDPYTLGVWLGNGTSADGTVTSNDPEIFSYIPYESKKTRAKFRYQIYGLRKFLRINHILGNKHIPDIYKFASINQRLALLQGLIDTDGYINQSGKNFEFTSARKRLFDDVVDLIRSLGGTVTTSEQLTRFDKESEYKLSYRLSARIGSGLCPARLKRKSCAWVGSIKTKAAIVDISFEKRDLGRCIKVEDELYITDDYLVTHNTTLTQICICYSVAHSMDTFIVVVEKSFTEAVEVLDVPRDQFTNNEMIRQVYGDLVKKSAAGVFDERNKDAQGDLFINGVRLRGKGFQTPIRGLKSAEWRPSRVLLDDVESDEHIQSDEQRTKYRDNYTKGILPALDVDCSLKVTGTILHFDSLLQNLIDKFDGKIYRAYDSSSPEPKKTLLWPERWTWERLMEKKNAMEMDGKGASSFFQEYLNQPIDDMRRSFKVEWLQRYFADADVKYKALYRTISIDPAESKKRGSDFTAVTVVDTDQENNWYLRYVKRYRVNGPELIDLIFELWRVWKPQIIGIEKKAFEDQIRPFLAIKSQETGVFPAVKELEHGGQRKEDRILGALQGRFESGKIYFAEGAKDDSNLLKGELYDFPYGKNDDLCLVGRTMVDTPFGKKRLDSIQIGDAVLTPFGFRRVMAFACTGEKQIFSRFGIDGTHDHPIFFDGVGFANLDTLEYNNVICKTLLTQIRWQYQKLLSSMEKPFVSWEGKEGITYLNQIRMKEDAILKDFMWRSGRFLMDRKFKKVLLFTIKMVIAIIIPLVTLSWLNVVSICQSIWLKDSKMSLLGKKIKLIYYLNRLKQLLGMEVKRVSSGTVKMLKDIGSIQFLRNACVSFVEKASLVCRPMPSYALMLVAPQKEEGLVRIMKLENVSTVSKVLKSISTEIQNPVLLYVGEPIQRKEKVFSITVDEVNCFYANGVLVGNCDTLAYQQSMSKRPYGGNTSIQPSVFKEFFETRKKNRQQSLASRL